MNYTEWTENLLSNAVYDILKVLFLIIVQQITKEKIVQVRFPASVHYCDRPKKSIILYDLLIFDSFFVYIQVLRFDAIH